MSMVDDMRKVGNTPEEDIDDEEDLPHIEVGPSEHRLQYTYGLWYIGKTNYQQYDFSLKKIGRFASVEQYWALYSHLVRPSDLNSPSDFFLFKDGIKPMWEHKGNRAGGQWIVRLNKGLAARCWENLVLAILGEQFDVGDEICGAGVAMRQKKDCISLWNKNSSDQLVTEKIRDVMRKVLNLPTHIAMEYRYHKDFITWINHRDPKESSGGDGAPVPRTPTTPGSSAPGGFGNPSPSTKPRPGSPSFDSVPSREGRGAQQNNLSSSNSSTTHR